MEPDLSYNGKKIIDLHLEKLNDLQKKQIENLSGSYPREFGSYKQSLQNILTKSVCTGFIRTEGGGNHHYIFFYDFNIFP